MSGTLWSEGISLGDNLLDWESCCLSPESHERHIKRLQRERKIRRSIEAEAQNQGVVIIHEPLRFERAILCSNCQAYLGSVDKGITKQHKPGCGQVVEGSFRPVERQTGRSNHGEGTTVASQGDQTVVDERAPSIQVYRNEGRDRGRPVLPAPAWESPARRLVR